VGEEYLENHAKNKPVGGTGQPMVKSSREKKRILLVEDEEDAREIATLTLEEYTLICASNFDEGLLTARLGYFDLYIIDNWLPDRNGVELCRHIREFDPYTPILFYSAAAYGRDKQAAFSAGAQAYLVKPVSFDDMTRTVVRLTSVPPETAFEARRAEATAIVEDLTIRQMENAERLEKAKQKRLRAEEKLLRDKALIAFLAAGGTRGAFAREWLSVLMEEVRGDRTSGSAGG
jgi:DNA-binding response OmpR family regulator